MDDFELRSDEVLSSHAGGGWAATDLDAPDANQARQRWAESVVVIALAGALLAGAALALGGPSRSAVQTPPPPPPASPSLGLACRMPGITCHDGRIRVAGTLAVPVSFVPVPGADTDDISPSRYGVEIRRTEGTHVSGLRVVESPVAVDGSATRRAPGLAGASAARVAWWLAARSFVAPTAPEAVRVGSLTGYRVAVRLRDGAVLPGFDEGRSAGVTFLNHGGTGRGETLAVSARVRTSYYYLLDLRGFGLVVVWVWTWDGGSQQLGAMDAMVASLRFG